MRNYYFVISRVPNTRAFGMNSHDRSWRSHVLPIGTVLWRFFKLKFVFSTKHAWFAPTRRVVTDTLSYSLYRDCIFVDYYMIYTDAVCMFLKFFLIIKFIFDSFVNSTTKLNIIKNLRPNIYIYNICMYVFNKLIMHCISYLVQFYNMCLFK